MKRARLDKATEITVASASSSLAFPSATTDGVPINTATSNVSQSSAAGPAMAGGMWHAPGGGAWDAVVFITATQAQTFSAALGLYGFRADNSNWYLLGVLNNGTAIATLGATTGFSQAVNCIGVFDRLAVGSLASAAVTPGSGTTTITICQAIVMGQS